MDKLKVGADRLGLKLTQHQLDLFQTYYEELVDWNQRVNLTAITDFEEVQVRHFLDSLTVAAVLEHEPDHQKIIDVGSGAGLPGIPLKILLPKIPIVLIDSIGKKTAFLHHIVERLGLSDVDIVTGRAEDVAHHAHYREGYQIALGRAVARLPVLLELTLPFCAIGGRVIAQKKGNVYEELESASNAIEMLGGRLQDIKSISTTVIPDERFLIIVEKVRPSPPAYPRRAGMPAKRPL